MVRSLNKSKSGQMVKDCHVLGRLKDICLTFCLVFILSVQSLDVLAGNDFEDLPAESRQFLEPLKPEWGQLSEQERNRWIGLSRHYQSASPDKRSKMEVRVKKWSELSADQKEKARQNYQALKDKPRGERNSTWNSYQKHQQSERVKQGNSANSND